MAITKIHGIKATVNKAIEYICNPDKTDEKLFISSFACASETAALDFKYTLDHTSEHDFPKGQDRANKAFHLIQAFSPDEVTFEEAHTIGKELADRLLKGKYSYVLTTHIDKGHVHNHLIFCAADNINHNHYHDCKQSYYEIRKLSDQLCREHHLSIVEPDGKRGMKYNEWQADKDDTSRKKQLRKDINQSIKAASTYDDFLALMKAKGYEIKGESLDESGSKYISFRPLGRERFVRGSMKSLGKNFTKERINERIENKKTRPATLLKSEKNLQTIIDASSDPKFTENAGLKKWATKENLKIAAATFRQMTDKGIHNFTELDEKISFFQEEIKSANDSIVTLEHEMQELAETIKYAEQYRENKSYNERYEKSKDQDRYLRKYESKIILFGGAERMLQRKGIDPAHMGLEKLKSHYAELQEKKQTLSSRCKTSQTEIKELELMRQNMEQYLDIAPKNLEKIQDTNHSLGR
ncbi:MAG: relaxase/mobilization nuclease domain-containing protein [Hespellia sp.]|nr:relaxase/mobilization nuclease domain-containing protein [Hespellia sp.]